MENINVDNLKAQFERIGARLEVSVNEARYRTSRLYRWGGERTNWSPAAPFTANVRTDADGEHFTMSIGDNSMIPDSEFTKKNPRMDLSKVQVLDTQPKDRHLVLQVTLGEGRNLQVDKFLMGHDERHWFMARVGGGVTTVQEAKASLQPAEIRENVKRSKVKKSSRNKRRNKAFIRQGEWFFMPTEFVPGKNAILSKNEPLVRGGGGKPHIAEEACRMGGETVMVHSRYAPNGISMDAYNKLRNENAQNPEFLRSGSWRTLTRNATVYVRGKIRHPDHKTVVLKRWYQVVPNTEQRRVNGRLTTMTFLD